MAMPGFTAERSLASFRLSHRLTKPRDADLYSRLRPMQSSETGEGIAYDLPGHIDGGGGNGSTSPTDGTSDGTAAADGTSDGTAAADGTSDGTISDGTTSDNGDGGTLYAGPDAGSPDAGTPYQSPPYSCNGLACQCWDLSLIHI